MILACFLAVSMMGQQVEYLSDNPSLFQRQTQGWGELGLNECAHAAGQTPLKLQIGEKHYAKGLGHHASGRIVVDLEGRYAAFDAEVGVQKQGSSEGSVIFRAYVDGKKAFDSGLMRQDSPPKSVHLKLDGAQELVLESNDAGDGITCDCADWADARLSLKPGAKPALKEVFDLAPFGQVTTWDPTRNDGARASRIEEFHAEDVFLDQPMKPQPNGGYRLTHRNGCIGILWLEKRRPTELTVAFDPSMGQPRSLLVTVEAWTGAYPFQGTWRRLSGKLTDTAQGFAFAIDPKRNPEFRQGFRKFRWILPKGSDEDVVVTRLTATTLVRMKTAKLLLQSERLKGTAMVRPFSCTLAGTSQTWDLTKPMHITVRYPAGFDGEEAPDQPAMRVHLPNATRTVRLADALSGNGIYLKDDGLFLGADRPGVSLNAAKKRASSLKTVLERVRAMPDQTFARAMKRTYRDVHFGSPTLVSVGADNWKWLAEPDGAIDWLPAPEPPEVQLPFEQRHCRIAVTYESMPLSPARKPTLAEGMRRWMPVAVRERIGISGKCTTTAYAAPIDAHRNVLVEAISLRGTLGNGVEVRFLTDRFKGTVPRLALDGTHLRVLDGDRLMAFASLSELGNFRAVVENGVLRISGSGNGVLTLLIPGWEASASETLGFDPGRLQSGFVDYWNAFAQEGIQIQIPDRLLSDIIQSSRVRCLVDARARGVDRLAPWIAEIHYGPLESEANTIIRGMALMGHRDFSRKALDYFIGLYNPAGFLTTGYTLVGTGWHLWTLGEAFGLYQDKNWLKQHADEIARVCRWVVNERHKTMKLDPLGQKPPQYGLVTPGVIADWDAFQYYFYSNGTFCAGLESAGKALKTIGHPEADSFLKEAAAYRKDIVCAYRWAQERTPAVPLQDGTYVPGQPSQVHCPGPLSGYFPGDDASRSWCYDVEVGPHNLIQQGVLPPDGPDSRQIADFLEDVMYLKNGWGDYPSTESQKDWFDLGGFSKVQPYYSRLLEVYAMRDDAKPFLRGYFNMIASLIDPSNLTVWEHFDHYGAPDKTHETGVFLQQTRFMFVKERGAELWLAPMVTNNWLKDGMVVSVQHAPTLFGEVGYRIESHVAKGYVDATVMPPSRTTPSMLVLRLRHPKGLKMKQVTVNGKPWRDFDPKSETIVLPSGRTELTIRAQF